jgi:integrase
MISLVLCTRDSFLPVHSITTKTVHPVCTLEMKMSKPLTAVAVAKFKPAAVRRRIRDGGARSLFLIVEPSGHKSWQMRFRRPDGKIGKVVLGPLDLSGRELEGELKIGQPLSLSAARSLAADVHRQRAMGADVIGDHKAARHRARTAAVAQNEATFGAAVRDYAEKHARPSMRGWRVTVRMLGLWYDDDADDQKEPRVIEGGLAALWSNKDVKTINSSDIWAVVEDAKNRGVPGLSVKNTGSSESRARLLHAALSSMFTWLISQRRAEVNPCAGVRVKQSEARERCLTADEVRWFWLACDGAGQPYASIFKLLLLTGQRREEVGAMRRSELHDGSAMWRLPSERTKNGKPHVVPLPPVARELIANFPVEAEMIFSTTGRTPPSDFARAKQRLDEAMLMIARQERGAAFAIPDWRVHDLRRTAVTGMVELGIQPNVVELVVNHASGHKAGVAGIYNKSELINERKIALERWSQHVLGVVEGRPANVVPMRAAGKE